MINNFSITISLQNERIGFRWNEIIIPITNLWTYVKRHPFIEYCYYFLYVWKTKIDWVFTKYNITFPGGVQIFIYLSIIQFRQIVRVLLLIWWAKNIFSLHIMKNSSLYWFWFQPQTHIKISLIKLRDNNFTVANI